MPVSKPHLFTAGIHFLTFTNYKWLPLIDMTESYDLVYKWFNCLQSNGHRIVGYVIMPNHLHALIAFDNTSQSLNTIIGNGKRFIAYGIIQRLKEAGRTDILEQLNNAVSISDKSRGKLHEVFEPSFDIKECRGLKFINQKLDYVHANPLSKKWSLAERTIDYVHSSALYYETERQGVFPVTNFIELIDQHWDMSSAPEP